MASQRFVARRGCPAEIYADNGTNLVGADKEMKNAMRELCEDQIVAELTSKGIQWTHIPPVSPHMGGSWERLVRSVKIAIKAILKEQAPKEETSFTALIQAEHIVNSRPLTHVSCYKVALTPNHFLIGSSCGAPICGIFTKIDMISTKQWRRAEFLANQFWKRWVREYLPTLIRRTKWFKNTRNAKVGDVVVVADDLSRNSWPMGIIEPVYPGHDGNVGFVDVKTQHGTYRRPIADICILDVTEERI